MSVDGTAIIKNEPASLSDINLSWGPIFPSPDGKKLVITGDWGAMGLSDVTKGKFETLNHYMDNVSVAFFNWFPDSRQILFRDSMGNLILADPITGEHTNLVVPGYGNVDGAAASPDGQDIVYSLSKHLGAPDEIWIINTDGRDSRLLTNGPAPVTNMAWSPNGKLIAFFGLGWMVMNADGSNLRELTSGINLPQCYSLPTIWSPDSNFLAVVTTKVNGSFCQGWGDKNFDTTNIILINVSNGKDYPLLSDDSTGNIDPAWSPDGSYIAFVSNRSGTPEVWVVKSDGSDLRQITEYDSLTRYPLWRRPY
jgi:TolB protein